VDIFQPCVTFNRVNTYDWFQENSYYLEDDHNPSDRRAAFARAIETEKYPLGILYRGPEKTTFEKTLGEDLPAEGKPLYQRKFDRDRLVQLFAGLRI
jgi:2-oxoglutarate ferredoxin oxidoreductase subunit beta